MSKIEEAKEVIMQLQAVLGLHASMVASGESPSETSTSTKLYAQKRARQWLDSLELPKPVRDWQPHQQRVWVEKQELDVKATKLSEFIGHSQVFEGLPFEEQHLLREQCEAMWQYSHFLGKRIERFFAPPPDDMVNELSESAGLTLDKLVAVVEATESISRLETIESPAPREPEAVTVCVRMSHGAEPLNAEKAEELDEYLQQQIKRRKELLKLFSVQDSERPAFVVAHTYEEALEKWKVAVTEQDDTGRKFEEDPPAGVVFVCSGDELIIDQGFADKANL